MALVEREVFEVESPSVPLVLVHVVSWTGDLFFGFVLEEPARRSELQILRRLEGLEEILSNRPEVLLLHVLAWAHSSRSVFHQLRQSRLLFDRRTPGLVVLSCEKCEVIGSSALELRV